MNIKEALESEEGKAAIAAAVETATKGLKTKNDELIGNLKKEKEARASAQEQLDQIKTEKEEAETAAAAKTGDIEKVKRQLEDKHRAEMAKRETDLAATKTKLDQVLIDGGISSALVKANVAPQFHDAVKALLKTSHKTELVDKDGSTVAHIDGKPLEEFFTAWSQGDQGKHYVAAPANGGGGAPGSNSKANGGAAKQMKRSEFDAMSAKDRAKTMASGPIELVE